MNMIGDFSQRESASGPFPPHVTLVGGIECPSMEFFRDVFLPRLQTCIAAAAIRGIHCQFKQEPVLNDAWNQACVLVMEASNEFTHLVELCRTVVSEVLSSSVEPRDEMNHGYPPPLRKPHLSLYYGSLEFAPAPDEVNQRLLGPGFFSFQGDQVAIWQTEPSSAEGVALWRYIASIDL
jgi:Cyclic phosphodiesterase-like protein